MRLVDKRVAAFFTLLYLAASLGLVTAGMLLEIAELPGRLAGRADPRTVIADLLWFAPPFYANFSPLAVLLAGCACFALMGKYQEITALSSAGLRPARIWLPAALASLLLGIPPLVVGETLVPRALARKTGERVVSRPVLALPEIFISGRSFDPGTMEMTGLTLVRFRDDGSIGEVYLAERTTLSDAPGWPGRRVTRITFDPEGMVTGRSDFEEAPIPVPFSRDAALALLSPLETLDSGRLRSYLALLSRAGLDPPPVRTFYLGRYSYHLLNLMVSFFFLPLVFRRRPGRPLLITGALVSGFAGYWLFSFGLALGNNGTLPPQAAVIAPHLVTAAAGAAIIMLSGGRRRPLPAPAAPVDHRA